MSRCVCVLCLSVCMSVCCVSVCLCVRERVRARERERVVSCDSARRQIAKKDDAEHHIPVHQLPPRPLS